MLIEAPRWSDRIAVEDLGGVPYRIYVERPHRIEQLLALAERWGDRVHMIQGERDVSFRGLRCGTARKARELTRSGVRSGDRVMLFGSNSPDWVMNFWGCIQVGAVPVLADAEWDESEVEHALSLLHPAAVLADAHGASRIPAAWRSGTWATCEDPGGALEPPVVDANASLPGENEAAVIVFTSGSATSAKAVELSHRALLSGLQMTLHTTAQLPLRIDAPRSEIVLQTSPLFDAQGPLAMLRSLAEGSTLVFASDRYDPACVLDLIERHQVTRWMGEPMLIACALEEAELERHDLRSLRAIETGGASVSPSVLQRLCAGLSDKQANVVIGYGLPQVAGPITSAPGEEALKYPGTCGRALPCVQLRIKARSGRADGEVLVRSPTQMSGYCGNERSPIDRDGWLHTGDLGKMDDAGRLWITSRSQEPGRRARAGAGRLDRIEADALQTRLET